VRHTSALTSAAHDATAAARTSAAHDAARAWAGQFRALADQLFGDQKHHAVTRQAAVDQMRLNSDFFGIYFEAAHEFHAYLRDMGRSRTWGDELTLRAAVEAFGCRAHVVTSEPANWYLVYQPEGEPLTSLPLPKARARRAPPSVPLGA